MPGPQRGLYEVLLTEALKERLQGVADGGKLKPRQTALRAAEAADRIALHLSGVVEEAIASIDEKSRISQGIALARRLIEVIAETVDQPEIALERPLDVSEVLRAIEAKLPDGRSESIPEPLIPLLDTTLLTNAPGEPRVGTQIQAEIHSADRGDCRDRRST